MLDIKILLALGVVWGVMFGFFLYGFCRQILRKTTLQTVLQKGMPPKDSLSYPKYLLIPFFSRPTNGFKMKGTKISIEVITHKTGDTKMYRFVSFVIDCSQLVVTHECCLWADYCSHVMVVRKSSLPPISRVRAVLECSGDPNIFFEGIEVIDQNNGIRRFYEIKETIVKNATKSLKSFAVKPQTVRLCSKETFAPIFYSLSFETIGDKIKDFETKSTLPGIVVQPKLNWFEVWVHFLFLINWSFFSIIAFVIELNHYLADNQLILVSVFGSSLTSLLVTELIGFLYRRVIKSKFDMNCSPMKTSLKRSSTFWQIIRVIALIAIFLTSLLWSLLLTVIIPKDKSVKKILKIEWIDETVLLLCLLICCLIIEFSFYLLIFGFIRFVYRFVTIRQSDHKDVEKNLRPKDVSEMSETSTQATNASDKIVDRKERGETLEEIREVTQKKATTPEKPVPKDSEEEYDSKGYRKGGKKLAFNTDRLEKEFADKEKKKKLTTKSVITSPAKSKGFLNPEDFRLTNSRINRENQKKNKKKKK